MLARLPLLAFVFALLLSAGCREADAPAPDADGTAPVETVAFTDEETVLYEVFVRNFSEEGTFAAVTARLDSLQALGV
ncbi:MAG: alpha-amylase, partial [Bacteroidota bacterium]